MIPGVAQYLQGLARLLGEQVAPRLPTPYEQAGMIREPLHLQVVITEFEHAVARRVEEHRAIRAICARAAQQPSVPAALRARCAQSAQAQDEDLRVSALQAVNVQLRSLLIELHAALETLETLDPPIDRDAPGPDSIAALLADVWHELRQSTERRKRPMDRF